VATLLGGRAAEELVFGDITTGAGNDLERATALVRAMVTEYGMSEKLGTVTFGRKGDMVFIGRDLMKEKNYSERSAEMIDAEVKRLVEGQHQHARKILRKNMRYLKAMAETLLDRELLDGDEVESLLAGKKIKPRRKNPKPADPAPPESGAPAPAVDAVPSLRPQPANARSREDGDPRG